MDRIAGVASPPARPGPSFTCRLMFDRALTGYHGPLVWQNRAPMARKAMSHQPHERSLSAMPWIRKPRQGTKRETGVQPRSASFEVLVVAGTFVVRSREHPSRTGGREHRSWLRARSAAQSLRFSIRTSAETQRPVDGPASWLSRVQIAPSPQGRLKHRRSSPCHGRVDGRIDCARGLSTQEGRRGDCGNTGSQGCAARQRGTRGNRPSIVAGRLVSEAGRAWPTSSSERSSSARTTG